MRYESLPVNFSRLTSFGTFAWPKGNLGEIAKDTETGALLISDGEGWSDLDEARSSLINSVPSLAPSPTTAAAWYEANRSLANGDSYFAAKMGCECHACKLTRESENDRANIRAQQRADYLTMAAARTPVFDAKYAEVGENIKAQVGREYRVSLRESGGKVTAEVKGGGGIAGALNADAALAFENKSANQLSIGGAINFSGEITSAKIAPVKPHPFEALRDLMKSDPEYAWAWHCNIAMPIFDAMPYFNTEADRAKHHYNANRTAATILRNFFDVDTTKHRGFPEDPSQMTAASPTTQVRAERGWERLVTSDEAIPAGMRIVRSGHYGEEEAVVVEPKDIDKVLGETVALPPKLALRAEMKAPKAIGVKPPLSGFDITR